MARRDAHIFGPSPRRRWAGFTLIELVMVVVTVAIIGAIAVPKWAAAGQHYQLDMAVKRLTTDLQTGPRSRAMYGSASVTVTFNVQNEQYQIVGMTDPDHAGSAYVVSLAAAPYRTNIYSAAFGNAAQITYDGYGTPSAGGTVVLYLGSMKRTITIDGTSGAITVQ